LEKIDEWSDGEGDNHHFGNENHTAPTTCIFIYTLVFKFVASLARARVKALGSVDSAQQNAGPTEFKEFNFELDKRKNLENKKDKLRQEISKKEKEEV
jgi:hypothetical protein